LFYLGRAKAQLEFALFCRGLDVAASGAAPSLRSLAPELEELERDVTQAYRRLGAADQEGVFIRIKASLKVAQDLERERRFSGALLQYLEVCRALEAVNSMPAENLAPDALKSLSESFHTQLSGGKTDHSVGWLYWQMAQAALESGDANDLKQAAVILHHVAPRYFKYIARLEVGPAPRVVAAEVTVTLARWPYTSSLYDPASLLIKDVVESYKGRVRFVNENWGDSKLAERYGVKRYPVVFVNEAMVARPEDFGGWGATTGKYHPWKSPANQAKFKKDLARMIDLTLRGRAPAPNKAQAETEAVGEIAALPPLELRDIEGRRIESADLAGRVVIVEFWATWCPPCRSTLGWLGEVKQRYGDRVEVVTVAIESEEPEARKQAQSLKLVPRVVMGT